MFFIQTSTLPPRVHQKLTEQGVEGVVSKNNQTFNFHVERKDRYSKFVESQTRVQDRFFICEFMFGL